MGGTAGLFVGASLLSFVELIYFFSIRIYGTLKAKRGKNKIKKGQKNIQQQEKLHHQGYKQDRYVPESYYI